MLTTSSNLWEGSLFPVPQMPQVPQRKNAPTPGRSRVATTAFQGRITLARSALALCRRAPIIVFPSRSCSKSEQHHAADAYMDAEGELSWADVGVGIIWSRCRRSSSS